MRRTSSALAGIVVAALIFMSGRASAQGAIPNYTFVRDSAGLVYLVSGDQRVNIPIYPATDEQIRAVPLLDKWMNPSADGTDFEIGNRPDWAWSPPPPAAIAAPAQPAAPSQPSWQTIAKWNGEGSKTTEPFTVNGAWRVLATVSGGSSDQICVSAQNVADARLGVNECLHGTAETYNRVGANSGTYQMQIKGPIQGKWTVEVQALQ